MKSIPLACLALLCSGCPEENRSSEPAPNPEPPDCTGEATGECQAARLCEDPPGTELCPVTSCQDVADQGDGRYWVQPYTGGPAFEVSCLSSVAGGGYQLISAGRAMCGPRTCLDDATDCAGTIPPEQIDPDRPIELLVVVYPEGRTDPSWFVLTGLLPPGQDGLLDVILLERPAGESNDCFEYPNYCGPGADFEPNMVMVAHSDDFTPRATTCDSFWFFRGGLYCGQGGNADGHVWSIGMGPYCGTTGVDVSSAVSAEFGDVACGARSAIYFRYR